MDLKLFQTFIVVADESSFTKAAKVLNYGQPTISQHIAQLENYFDGQLFDRIGKKIYLTPLGKRIYQEAQLVLKAYDNLLSLGEQKTSHPVLRIGVYESLLHYRILDLISNFKKSWPHLELIVRHGICSELREMVRTGQLDLAFQIETDCSYKDLHTEKLVLEHFSLIFPKAIGQDMLSNPRATIYMTEKECTYRRAFEQLLSDKGIEKRHVMETGSVEVIKQYVGCGLGYALVPEVTTRDPVSQEKLEIVTTPLKESLYTQVFWHKKKTMSPVMVDFIAHLKDHSVSWR